MLLEVSLLLVLVFNIYVIYRVVKCGLLEKAQKVLQILFVLIFPIIGAVVILLFIRNIEKDNEPPSSGQFGGGTQKSLSNFEVFNGSD
ncbi:hypothetical protein GMES_4410 [Paraglaciecola mesophila KMM 241]|uniref:Cardiolipin synthase N-terminal domain-containing protein n=1 Tax=Paraglaciecola mesophila KMM 241 TaxID=1128912 RepID=K6YRR1_9ALTE|nr:hypothetical protein [Paraglaciecola mesophila]GAC26676.1 hypothetical protein GMES_4410 [Paraglaciecola mesophila KMM 241]|tara:strand:- start:189 stop:452 length:264 start_codon:yes stop_codon:yes gene_type:complete